MRNARAHKFQWSGPTVHSSTVPQLSNKTLYIAGIEQIYRPPARETSQKETQKFKNNHFVSFKNIELHVFNRNNSSPIVQSNCPVQLSSPTVQSNCPVQLSSPTVQSNCPVHVLYYARLEKLHRKKDRSLKIIISFSSKTFHTL